MKRNLWMLLVLPALLVALVGTGSALTQDGEGDGAATPEATQEPSGDGSAAPAGPKPIDVDALIAEYNAGREAPRTFTEEERGWIAMGLDPADCDDAQNGYAAIPSDDPFVVKYRRNGVDHEIRSNPDTATLPSGIEVGPFARETEERPNLWMPTAASETAKDVDAMFDFIMWTCYVSSAGILIAMIWLCIRFRRRPGVRADQSHTHHTGLEITWSVIPTILVAIMFWGGYVTFLDLRTPPPDAMTIDVTAQRWSWTFRYANGAESPGEIHVPANTPIELRMTSNDVLHSFHVPVYRQKLDVLRNRFTSIWFDSGEPGTYRVYCAEYCGKDHGNMYAKLVVEPQAEFDAWLEKTSNWTLGPDGEQLPLLEIGRLVYTRQGCNACHSIDGSKNTGPTFKGLWGKTRKFEDGSSRVADADYVLQSIRDPHSQLVVEDDGTKYGKQMTVYSPEVPLLQIQGMVEYLKELKD